MEEESSTPSTLTDAGKTAAAAARRGAPNRRRQHGGAAHRGSAPNRRRQHGGAAHRGGGGASSAALTQIENLSGEAHARAPLLASPIVSTIARPKRVTNSCLQAIARKRCHHFSSSSVDYRCSSWQTSTAQDSQVRNTFLQVLHTYLLLSPFYFTKVIIYKLRCELYPYYCHPQYYIWDRVVISN